MVDPRQCKQTTSSPPDGGGGGWYLGQACPASLTAWAIECLACPWVLKHGIFLLSPPNCLPPFTCAHDPFTVPLPRWRQERWAVASGLFKQSSTEVTGFGPHSSPQTHHEQNARVNVGGKKYC